MVEFCDEIVIIGCSLREEDDRIWSLINSLKEDVKELKKLVKVLTRDTEDGR